MVELKPGWGWVKFGDVVQLSKARSQKPLEDGYERYVGLEHIDPEDLRIRRWGSVADGTTFTSVFKPGQVLFGKRRAYQRKVAVADFAGVCSGDIYVLETRDPQVLLPELLPFICQSEAFFEFAVGTSAGSLSPRTNWTSLQEFGLSLPPRDQQFRLVAVLQAAEQAHKSLADAIDSAEILRRTSIFEVFESLQVNGPVSVEALGLSTECSLVQMNQAGQTLMGRQLSPKYRLGNSPRPYLRVANVFDGYIDSADVLEMDFSDDEFERYKLRSGDVLLNEGQSKELVGRSAIFCDEVPNCCFQNTLLRFRPSQGILPAYAHYYFQYCHYSGRFARIAKATTSIAHLGADRFSKLTFPVVPQGAQEAVVQLVSSAAAAVKGLRKRAEQVRTLKAAALKEVWG